MSATRTVASEGNEAASCLLCPRPPFGLDGTEMGFVDVDNTLVRANTFSMLQDHDALDLVSPSFP